MTQPNDDHLPPLGERTPLRHRRPHAGTPWYRRAWVAALAGLAGIVLGLLLGLAVAAWTDDDRQQATGDSGETVETTLPPRTTTTTVPTLPRECADAIRSAEQSLALLDQAFQTARRFDVEELDRMLSELQEVRRNLTERVRACIERA